MTVGFFEDGCDCPGVGSGALWCSLGGIARVSAHSPLGESGDGDEDAVTTHAPGWAGDKLTCCSTHSPELSAHWLILHASGRPSPRPSRSSSTSTRRSLSPGWRARACLHSSRRLWSSARLVVSLLPLAASLAVLKQVGHRFSRPNLTP